MGHTRPPLWIVIALLLAVPTAIRTQAWRTDLALWHSEVRANPHSLRGWANVANAAYHVNDYDESESAIQRTLVMTINTPYHPWMRELAWVTSMTTASKIFLVRGDPKGADRIMDEVIKRDPEFPPAVYQMGIVAAIRDGACTAGVPFWARAHAMDPMIKVPACE